MKNILNLLMLTILIAFSSCEDVVNVNLDTAPPKLVIDAALKWQKGTAGNIQTIKLTTTTDYYSTVIPVASGATVTITDDSNTIFTFTETPNTGLYICSNFVPVINKAYTLNVAYNGQIYSATDTLLETPTIDSIEQNTLPSFGGNQIQVKFYYQDNGAEINFYLIGFKNSAKTIPEYSVLKDNFFQGNQMFGFYTDNKLKTGDVLDMNLQGISEHYFNYLNELINISDNSGSPFATPPATLRGNIINQTNTDNYPLGYFSLGETDAKTYTVQ